MSVGPHLHIYTTPIHPHTIFHRAEIEAGESALEQVSASLTEARAKHLEAESKLREAQQALAEKEAMINYINEEVDRVKGKQANGNCVSGR